MLELKAISKAYGSQQVLSNVDFIIKSQEFISIVGKSGIGKTTLLSILAGLVRPDKGKSFFQNEEISNYNEEQLARFRLLNIGIVFQDFKIIPSLSSFDNVYLALHPRKDIEKSEKKERVKNMLKQVDLTHKLDDKVFNLSGGEKQRVAIARSLVGQPKLVLADEPTGNLDEASSESIIDLFQKLHKELSTAFVIITHDKDIANKTEKSYQLSSQKLELL